MAGETRVAVLGAGSAGYVAAIRAAQLGASVTLIETREVGGTCLNAGCIPTKALLASAGVYHACNAAGVFGVDSKEVTSDFKRMAERKEKVIRELVQGIHFLLKKNKITLMKGEGWLEDAGKLRVETEEGEREVSADRIIVASGSRPSTPPFFQIDESVVLTSDGMLHVRDIPRSLFIIGGGAIGLEFAGIYARLGARVTLVEMMPQVLPGEDAEVAEVLARQLKKEGVEVHVGTRVEELAAGPGGKAAARLDSGQSFEVEKVLVAVGRSANTEGIGLEDVGVAVEDGWVVVNERMETTVPGIYAAGDVTGGALLAHKASHEGIAAAENALGHEHAMSYEAVPSCIYTEPEVASVGLTEKGAKEKGIAVKVGRFPFIASGKARIMGHQEGLAKVVAEEFSGRIVGMQLVGPGVTELVAEGCLAIEKRITVEELGRVMHPHPTLSEVIMEACRAAAGAAIHI